MKNLFKGLLAVALLLIVSPSFAVEAAHTGSTMLTPAPDNSIWGIFQEGGKSQIIAAVLAWFLGGWGIHLFYLGYKKKGMTRLFMGLGGLLMYVVGAIFTALYVSSATAIFGVLGSLFYVIGGIILLIDWILGLIDFIKILTGDLKPAEGEYTDTI